MGSAERIRLAAYYNGNEYNASTNPGGMAKGGHRTNLVPAFQDVATVGQDCVEAADRADAAASQSGSWLAEGGVVSYLSSTQFRVAGADLTSRYAKMRALFLDQTTNAYGFVSSSSYSGGYTTVTVTGCSVDAGLTQVQYGQDPKNAPKLFGDSSDYGKFYSHEGTWAYAGQPWTPTTEFTRTGVGAGTVTHNAANQSLFRPGRPLRALSGSTYTYHLITAYSAGAVTVAGPALPTTIDALDYGDTTRVVQETFIFSGYFADGADSALIEHDLLARYVWRHGKAYCVWFSVRPLVDDSGAAQPRVNVSCAGSAVSTSNSNAGLAVDDTQWVSTTTDISSTNYDITWGEALEVSVDANGTNDNARDLTVIAVFVLE